MKRGTRDTIRRKPDYERDPDWDISDITEGRKRHPKGGVAEHRKRFEERESEDREVGGPEVD